MTVRQMGCKVQAGLLQIMCNDSVQTGCVIYIYLELTRSAEPHLILARQLGHPVARLMHGDAAHVTAQELIKVVVHVSVTHTAVVASPLHLHGHCSTALSAAIAHMSIRMHV
jgi:hypothetical protein